jgi:hypothetical protein
MKKTSFFILVLLISFIGKSLAIDVPPPPIDIDISNSSFKKIDSSKFRVRQLIAPDYSGSYWVDFLWNPDQLHFEPTSVGEETSTYGKHRVAIVDKSGKYYSDPVEALNDIATWCGIPTETNPCLVKILPGIFDIGTTTMRIPSYVDMEGSGEKVSKIKGNGSEGVLFAGLDSELRFLTIENYSEGMSRAYAIYFIAPHLQNITIIVKGNNNENYGILPTNNFFELPPSVIRLKNVTISVSGGNVNYGVYNDLIESRLTIEHSTIEGTTNSVYSKRGTTFISSTQLVGSTGGPAPLKCAGVYDEDFNFYADSCP